jgi:hypothetical protein
LWAARLPRRWLTPLQKFLRELFQGKRVRRVL